MKYKIREEEVAIGPVSLGVQVCGDTAAAPLILLHSLSGNADIFAGLLDAGIAGRFRVLIPEMRGRGNSSRPLEGYSLEQEADDLLAILDHYGIDKAVVCGHSFGGLLAACFAAWHPERTERLILIDAAAELNPLTPQLITMPLFRLFHAFPDWETYEEVFKAAPFVDKWDPGMRAFLRRDMREAEDGWLWPRSSWYGVMHATAHVMSVSKQEWRRRFSAIKCPMLLLQAENPFAFGQHILEEGPVIETLALVYSSQHRRVPGNHISMLYGAGARSIVSAMEAFSFPKPSARKRLLGIF